MDKEYNINELVMVLISLLESKGVLEKREVLNLLDKIEENKNGN